MRFYVGVTDNSWYGFLRNARPEEVNFWKPSAQKAFSGLEPGAPFLFKLKRPHNHIAGGGFFVKFSVLPLSIAWETFAQKNGAATRAGFEATIRPLTPDPDARDPDIGCAVLAEPFFWPDEDWIPMYAEWAGSIVSGRMYDTERHDDARVWSQVFERLQAIPYANLAAEPDKRYGTPTLINPRLGQGAFRVLVTDAYKRRCAITGESTLPVLEAAHILPFINSGPHQVSNGLLLRSDFHKLFDLGYVTVDTDLRVRVSKRIREDWFNGKAYYRLDGQPLQVLPEALDQRPKSDFLEWHNKEVFQA